MTLQILLIPSYYILSMWLGVICLIILTLYYIYFDNPQIKEFNQEIEKYRKNMKMLGYLDWHIEEWSRNFTTIEDYKKANYHIEKRMNRH